MGGSDDPRTSDDAHDPARPDGGATVEEAGTDDVPQGNRGASRPVSGGSQAVGKDRLAQPDQEMAHLMGDAPMPGADDRDHTADAGAAGDVKFAAAQSRADAAAAAGGDVKSADEDSDAASAADGDVNSADEGSDADASPGGDVNSADEDSDADASPDDTLKSADEGSGADPTADGGKSADEGSGADPSRDESAADDDAESTVEASGVGTKTASRADASAPDATVIPLTRAETRDTETEDDRRPRASRPVGATQPPVVESPRRVWPWLGVGVLVVGAATVFGLRNTETPPPTVTAGPSPAAAVGAISPAPQPDAETPVALDVPVAEPGADGSGTTDGSDPDPDPSTTAGVASPSGDPRQPPPGTDPEAAAAFRRLPVSPSDRPPIGGIGANGIHIDKIAMGSEVDNGACSGHATNFSVGRRERATVCVRVVHPREKQELQVLWQKHGGSTRRSKMVVQPMHAYRTRGHLKLRTEYIGDWTVRVVSAGGVELASQTFSIIP